MQHNYLLNYNQKMASHEIMEGYGRLSKGFESLSLWVLQL